MVLSLGPRFMGGRDGLSSPARPCLGSWSLNLQHHFSSLRSSCTLPSMIALVGSNSSLSPSANTAFAIAGVDFVSSLFPSLPRANFLASSPSWVFPHWLLMTRLIPAAVLALSETGRRRRPSPTKLLWLRSVVCINVDARQAQLRSSPQGWSRHAGKSCVRVVFQIFFFFFRCESCRSIYLQPKARK